MGPFDDLIPVQNRRSAAPPMLGQAPLAGPPNRPPAPPQEFGWRTLPDGSIEPVRGGPHDPTAGGRTASPIDPNLTGSDALAALPPADRRMVQGMMDGRIALPTQGRQATDPNWQRYLAEAQQVDPTLDATALRGRQTSWNAWNSGVQGRATQSANTTIGHLAAMDAAIDSLHNFGAMPVGNYTANQIRNYYTEQGSRSQQVAAFNAWRQALATELPTAMRGGQTAEADIRAWLAQLDPASTPEALHATVQTMIDALGSRIRASREQFRQAMGHPEAQLPMLTPESQRILTQFGHTDLMDPSAQQGPAAPPSGTQQRSPAAVPPAGGGEQMDTTRLTISEDQGDPGMHLSATERADPARAAFNAQIDRHFSRMLHSGAPDAEIQAFGAENQLDPNYTASILAWRRGVPVPGARGTFQQWHREHPRGLLPLEDLHPNVPLEGLPRVVAGAAASGPGTAVTHAANAIVPLSLDASVAGGDPDKVNLALEAQQQAHPRYALGGQLAGTAAAYWGGGKLAGMAGRALMRPGEEAAAALAAQEAAAGRTAVASGETSAVPSVNASQPSIQTRIGKWLAQPGPATPLNGRAIAGDAIYGTVQGQGDPTTIAASMGGGAGGRAVGRVAGLAARGVADAPTRFLTAQGVPLTVGQIAGQAGGRVGQFVRGIENRFSGLNPMIDHQYRQGIRSMNDVAFADAVKPIGGTAPGAIGERGLENVRAQRSAAYGKALNGRQFTADQPFIDELAQAIQTGRGIPGMGDQFNHIIKTRVLSLIGRNRPLTGENFQAALRGIRSARTQFAGQPLGHDFGQALTSVEDALTGLVRRQAPEVMPALEAANATNRHVSILGDAVRKAQANVESGDPMFTPFQLNQASIANTTRYGGREAATSTERPFFDLTRNAQEVLPNRVPDSGSGSRALVPLATGAALTAAGGAADYTGVTDNSTRNTLAIATILSGAHTNLGRRALQTLLVKRPDLLRRFGENVLSGPTQGRLGQAGAGTAVYETSNY